VIHLNLPAEIFPRGALLQECSIKEAFFVLVSRLVTAKGGRSLLELFLGFFERIQLLGRRRPDK
jgi:hypothetical protein